MKRANQYKKRILLTGITICFLAITLISSSYAIFKLTVAGTKNYKLTIGTLDFEIQSEANAIRLNNAYPMSDEQGKTLNPYTFTIKNTGSILAYYKISLIEDEEQKEACTNCTFLANNKLRFELKENGTTVAGPSLLSSTDNVLTTGSIAATATKNFELRLWLTSEATIEEANKRYYGKIKVEASQERYYAPVSGELFANENLGNNCTTYNDGTDTFLVGQCSNNYVWYSGKLWRVVLKNNSTGAVKMVTDNAITSIPYNASGNTAFKDSYADQWLNQEFLPTLHDYEGYLVTNSVWDATLDASDTPTRPNGTTTVERTVGLLNAYEYYTTYAQSGGLATSSNTYLKNNVYWWLITPYNDASNVRYVYDNGDLNNSNPTNGLGARPSVNLKSGVQINSGSGSKSDPYILKGDVQETIAGTTHLSTRYSGEYITFNNELYRIVGVENGLTKITAVDNPSSLMSNKFHSTSGVASFANASIKIDLETYYQGLEDTWKNMVEPNTTWYLGIVGDGTNYKASICANIDASASMNACTSKASAVSANIALPRVGEMFTSQITRKGTKDNFWTLTPYNETPEIHYISGYGSLFYSSPPYGLGARPSMYLKSNVVIARNNSGNGTYEYPYKIELAS